MWRRSFVSVVVVVALSGIGAGFFVSQRVNRPGGARSEATEPDNARADSAGAPPAGSLRPNYLYSVVPGGVESALEIADVMARDPIVAAHYAHVRPAAIAPAFLDTPLLAHVSYRIGDEVFWTKERVRLRAGEPVLTDGTTTIRQRCGNIISVEPLGPSSSAEPPLPSFDLVVTPGAIVAPLPVTVMPPPAAAPRTTVPPASRPSPPRADFLPPSSPPDTPTPVPIIPEPFPEPEPEPVPVPVPEPGTFMLVGLGAAYCLVQYLRSGRRPRY